MTMSPGQTIDVIKLNPERRETWRYTGKVIARSPDKVVLEAFFNRPDTPFNGIILANQDRFIEAYFSRRWYNIYEIHDGHNNRLKGWYCNVALPAEFGDVTVTFVDLALDLLVFPDGRQLVLDEDEFDALTLDEPVRQRARTALEELQALVRDGELDGIFEI